MRTGRLAAKLLVFDRRAALRAFWRKGMGGDVGRECLGVVNAMATEVEDTVLNTRELRGDSRYFCIIGLCLGNLTVEIISHEAVHAAFCYEKRVKRNLFGSIGDFDEERIAYPAGAIAAGINDFLHAKDLYDRKPSGRR
jgi:hypothetical protein